MTVPTMNKMVKVYLESAFVERLKCGRPNEGTVKNTLVGYRAFLRWLNKRREKAGLDRMSLTDDFPLVSIIRPSLIHKYLSDMLRDGKRPITAISSLYQLRQLFAKWVLPYYEDHGWKVPLFPPFGHRPKAPRYNRPDVATLAKVKEWYRSLPSGGLWFVATMMLEFAMRNGDILRLRRDNFVERDGRVFLNYTPHKTKHSSGRMVKWPVHPSIWEQITSIFNGDDIRTIMYYYADRAQPNIDNIRVTDLL